MGIEKGERFEGVVERWDDWLRGPACDVGAHPTVFHHQHVIGPAKWHCFCGEVTREAESREVL